MNDEKTPPDDRAELEARVTALLLGELSAEDAAAMRQIMARDAGLAKLHERLRLTLDLVRESAATPAGELTGQPVPLKLSPARREALLAHFKTLAPKELARPRAINTSRILELAAAVAILLVAAALLLPSLSSAKYRLAAKAGLNLASQAEPAGRLLWSGDKPQLVAASRQSAAVSAPLNPNLNPKPNPQPLMTVTAAKPPPPPASPIYLGAPSGGSSSEQLADQGLKLNMRGVSVDQALSALSESEGLTIIRQANTRLPATVDLTSDKELSKDEKVALLNKVLANNGLTAIQDKNTLTVMTTEDAGHNAGVPINTWTSGAAVPADSQVVTEIVPVHHLNPTEVIKDLHAALPQGAQVNSSESGDAIIMTAPHADVRRAVQSIRALDTPGHTNLNVALLQHTDSKSLADQFKDLSATQDKDAGEGNPFASLSGGRGFLGSGGGGGLAGGAGGTANSWYGTQGQVAPVTMTVDPMSGNIIYITTPANSSSSLAVTEALDMPGKQRLVPAENGPSLVADEGHAGLTNGVASVYVYHVQNGDALDLAGPLGDLFPRPSGMSASNTSTLQNPLQQRANSGATLAMATASSTLSGNTGGGGGGGFGGGGIVAGGAIGGFPVGRDSVEPKLDGTGGTGGGATGGRIVGYAGHLRRCKRWQGCCSRN